MKKRKKFNLEDFEIEIYNTADLLESEREDRPKGLRVSTCLNEKEKTRLKYWRRFLKRNRAYLSVCDLMNQALSSTRDKGVLEVLKNWSPRSPQDYYYKEWIYDHFDINIWDGYFDEERDCRCIDVMRESFALFQDVRRDNFSEVLHRANVFYEAHEEQLNPIKDGVGYVLSIIEDHFPYARDKDVAIEINPYTLIDEIKNAIRKSISKKHVVQVHRTWHSEEDVMDSFKEYIRRHHPMQDYFKKMDVIPHEWRLFSNHKKLQFGLYEDCLKAYDNNITHGKAGVENMKYKNKKGEELDLRAKQEKYYRHIGIADQIIRNAALGTFPGEYDSQ